MTSEHRNIGGLERARAKSGRPRGSPTPLKVFIVAFAVLAVTACEQKQAGDADAAAPDVAQAPEATPKQTPETASAMDAAPPDSVAELAEDGQAVTSETATASERPAPAGEARDAATDRSPRAAVETVSRPDPMPAGDAAAAPNGPAAEAPAAHPAPAAEVVRSDTPPAGGQSGGEKGGGAETSGKASLVASEDVYQGWKYFSANCERCHGQDGLGSSFAPSLIRSLGESSIAGGGPVNHDVFIGTVTAGRLAKGMPAWKDLLTSQQIEQLWAYASARASGKLSPGRPQRAPS